MYLNSFLKHEDFFCINYIFNSLFTISQTLDKYYGISTVFDHYSIQSGYSFGKVEGFVSEKKAIMLNYNLKDFRKGITASYSYGAFFCFGADLSALYYKNFEAVIKPKIGIGMPVFFNVFYGYNFSTSAHRSCGTWSFEINIPIKTKTDTKGGMMFGLLNKL